MPVTAPAATNGIRLVWDLIAVGCNVFNSPRKAPPANLGCKAFSFTTFGLQGYHDYFSDLTHHSFDILPIAIIKKAYFAEISQRSEGAQNHQET